VQDVVLGGRRASRLRTDRRLGAQAGAGRRGWACRDLTNYRAGTPRCAAPRRAAVAEPPRAVELREQQVIRSLGRALRGAGRW
jgi:hypothetical protein